METTEQMTLESFYDSLLTISTLVNRPVTSLTNEEKAMLQDARAQLVGTSRARLDQTLLPAFSSIRTMGEQFDRIVERMGGDLPPLPVFEETMTDLDIDAFYSSYQARWSVLARTYEEVAVIDYAISQLLKTSGKRVTAILAELKPTQTDAYLQQITPYDVEQITAKVSLMRYRLSLRVEAFDKAFQAVSRLATWREKRYQGGCA